MSSNVSEPPRPAASLRIFLLHGTPEGPQLAEKSNWTGHAIRCSRAQYPALRGRPEFGRAGLYVLVAPVEGSDPPRIYVGEADVARSRLDDHAEPRISGRTWCSSPARTATSTRRTSSTWRPD